MIVQSIIFKKKYWTTKQAKAWLKKNEYKFDDVDKKEETIRFRQAFPNGKHSYFTKKGKRKGVAYVMMV